MRRCEIRCAFEVVDGLVAARRDASVAVETNLPVVEGIGGGADVRRSPPMREQENRMIANG
jgi:hypothetical protein